MIAHQLDADGVIVTTLEVDSLDILANLVEATMGGGRGDKVVKGKLVPQGPKVISDEENDADVMAQLLKIDLASIRPLRENDKAMLATLTAQAVDLRSKLKRVK